MRTTNQLTSLVFGRKDNIMKIKVKFTKPRTYKAIFVFFNDSTSIGEWV